MEAVKITQNVVHAPPGQVLRFVREENSWKLQSGQFSRRFCQLDRNRIENEGNNSTWLPLS